MRVIDAGVTWVRQATSSPTPRAHATAALIGETWVTTTTVPSLAIGDSSSSADRTRSPSATSDSPPGGVKVTSDRQRSHVPAGRSAKGRPSNSP